MSIAYLILLVISLIFITHSLSLISLYSTDTIAIDPNRSSWLWLSIGVAGVLGAFGTYYAVKGLWNEPVQTTEPIQISRLYKQSNRSTNPTRDTLRKASTQDGILPKSLKSAEDYGYGVMPMKSSEYDKVPPETFRSDKPEHSQYVTMKRDLVQCEKISDEDIPEPMRKGARLQLPNLPGEEVNF